MNKTLAITAITLVAVVMGLSAVAPAMAMGNAPLYINACLVSTDGTGSCSMYVDADHNGCDANDRQITLPLKTVVKAGFSDCPLTPR